MNYWSAKMLRGAAFLAGDIRAVPRAPWVSLGSHTPLCDTGEATEALQTARYGDVGLHRDRGYLTNLTIPGALKHAWIHTDSGAANTILEATSEGVHLKHALGPYITDYGVVLRPRGVTDPQTRGACVRAKSIDGADYDTSFHFNIEEELQYYETQQHQNLLDARQELSRQEQLLVRWQNAFSCSEAVAYCWWHARETCSIYRNSWMGRSVILPVDFLGFNFEIVWCSRSWTLDVARAQGLNEQGLDRLQSFLRGGAQ